MGWITVQGQPTPDHGVGHRPDRDQSTCNCTISALEVSCAQDPHVYGFASARRYHGHSTHSHTHHISQIKLSSLLRPTHNHAGHELGVDCTQSPNLRNAQRVIFAWRVTVTALASVIVSLLFWLLAIICESVTDEASCSYPGLGPHNYITDMAAVLVAFNIVKVEREIEFLCAELVSVAYLRAVVSWLINL